MTENRRKYDTKYNCFLIYSKIGGTVYLIFGPPGAHYIKFLVLSYLIVFAYPPLQNCMMHFKCAGEVFGIPVKDTKGRF